MRCVFLTRFAIVFLFLCRAAYCQPPTQQLNPHTQIRWPINCQNPNMAYNWQNNTCVATGPVGNTGEIQMNNGGFWYSLPGLNFNPTTNTLNAPNLTVTGISNISVPPTQVVWPPTCSTGVYAPATNTCVPTGTANNPAPPTGTLQMNSGGNFGPVTNSTADTSGNVTLATLGSNVNATLYVKAPPYSAKCDGVTDDQGTASPPRGIQGAFTDALKGSSNPLCTANGCSVQFPAGTCLTSTIVYKGQSFFGAGKGITYIKGKPGIDVFQTPDNNSFALPQNTTIHDLNIVVDTTVNAASTVVGGSGFYPNRIGGTAQNLTQLSTPIVPGNTVFGVGNCAGGGADTTLNGSQVSIHCTTGQIGYQLAAVAPDLVIGAQITINGAGASGGVYTGTITGINSGCTGSTSCLLAVNPVTPTAITNATGNMLNKQTPPWYYGNGGIVLQCSNSGSCGGTAQGWNIYNVEFDPSSLTYMDQNHCVGFFSQVPVYGSHFEKMLFLNLYGEYVEASPLSGGIGTSDTSSFKDMDFYHGVTPMVAIQGNGRDLSNVNFYSEYPLQAGPYYFPVTATGTLGWTIHGIYMEGSFLQSGEIARLQSGLGSFHITGANVFGGPQTTGGIAWVEFLSNGSNVDGYLGNALQVDGNMNDFRNFSQPSQMITDNGHGNRFYAMAQAGTPAYQGRRYNPSRSPDREQLGTLNGSFLLSGNSTTPYINESDLLTTCSDWTFTYNPSVSRPTYGSCVADPNGTEISKRYFQSANPTQIFALGTNGTVYQNMWAGAARTFGISNTSANGGPSSIVPRTKVLVSINLQCVGASTCTTVGHVKDGTTSANITTSPTLNFTNTWSTQTFVADLSSTTVGDVLDFWLDTWSNAGTSYQLAWIAVSPLRTDPFFSSILYSAAGTPLPTCAAANKGQQATVSDATTSSGTYTSGGTNTVPVLCNGSTWLIVATGAVTATGVADVDVTVPVLTAITANTCWGSTGSTTPATFTMTGLTTAMGVRPMDTGNPSAITGWGAVGGLTIRPWASAANTGSYVVCNTSGSSITSGSIVIRMGAQ